MGLLKKIKKTVKKVVKAPVKLASGVAGVALGSLLGGGKSGGGSQPQAAAQSYAPSLEDYGGDTTDPGYGSFTDPFTVEDFYNQADPGYAFELQQGQQALLNSAAAGSGSMSGAALKDLLGYSQNFARTGYNDAFNRYQTSQGNIYSRLMGVAQLGQNAAAGVGAQGTQLAGNAGQAIANAGAASGAGIVGAGNAIGQGATNYWLFKNPQLWSGGGGSV